MIPAILYAAKSTADPRGSIPTQLADTRAAAEGEGRQVVQDYSDENASAYKGNRGAGLARAKEHALALAREHGAAEFWIQHSDRVARGDGVDADHLGEVWFALKKGHVRMRSVDDDHNLEDAIRVILIGERNHEDSARKATNVARGMRKRKVERGLHNGGDKFGYRLEVDQYGNAVPDRPRVIVPSEARIVERIFRDLHRNISQHQLARELNDEHIPTARGGRWHQGTVGKIARDVYYAGHYRDGDDLVLGQHDAIIDLDLWQTVQAIMAERKFRGDGQPGRTSNRPALFTHGHLRCGRCGAPMGIRRNHTRNGKPYVWEKYVCRGRERDRRSCSMAPIDADAVETMMLDELRREPGQLVDRIRDAIATIVSDRATTADLLLEAERALAAADDRVDRVKSDYLDGRLAADDYTEFKPRVEDERAAAAAEVERLRARAGQLQTTLADDDLDDAVARVLARINDALSDAGRIETARNVIRSAWPKITAHRDGDDVWLDTGDVSDGFARALSSTIEYEGLPMISFVERS
jgi:hypothetical protein